MDWNQADPKITMQIIDVNGKERINRKIRLSELKFWESESVDKSKCDSSTGELYLLPNSV